MLERNLSERRIPSLQLGIFSPSGSPTSSSREVEQFKRVFNDMGEIDKTLLMNLTDKELFNECLNNERINLLCQDETFWEKRFRHYFGDKVSINKPATRKWKNHYMKVSMDLDRYLPDPFSFFDIIEWDVKAPISSIKFCSKSLISGETNKCEPGTALPLSASPEWIVNNYNLLNLGNHLILRFCFPFSSKEGKTCSFEDEEFVAPLGMYFTPSSLLTLISEYFASRSDISSPLYFKGMNKHPDYVEVLFS